MTKPFNSGLGLGKRATLRVDGQVTPITGAPRRKLAPYGFAGQPMQPDSEVGSPFDLWNGRLAFPTEADTRVWDLSEPTPWQVDEMLRRDGKAMSIYRVLTLPITSAPWAIKPPEGNEGLVNADIVSFVTNALSRPKSDGGMATPMSTILAQVCSAVAYRRMYFEKIYTRKDNRIVYSDIAYRPPSGCTMRRQPGSGRLLGFSQQVPGEIYPAEILGQYSYVHINGTARNPISGTCDMEPTYWAYVAKEKIKMLWFSYLENQSLPRVIASANGETSAAELAKAIASLKNNGVVGIPDSWVGKGGINPLNVAGHGSEQFQQALHWLDSQASYSVLAGFTDLSSSALTAGRGSAALSNDQSSFFMDMEVSLANAIGDSITDGIIADLVHLNFGPDVVVPEFKIGPLTTESIQEQTTMLQALMTSPNSAAPDEFVRDLLMEVGRAWGFDLDKLDQSVKDWQAKLEQEAKTQQQANMVPAVAAATVGGRVVNAISDANSPNSKTGNENQR